MRGYFKLYSWLRHTFGDNPFTLAQFKATFSSQQPTKILHDLARLGYVERVGRGEYIANNPREITDAEVQNDLSKINILDDTVEKPFAFSHANAVRIHSDGIHHPEITAGFMPIHITVLEQDLAWWKKFLKSRDARFITDGERKTLYGVVYILHPAKKLDAVERHGMPVTSLEETIKYLTSLGDEYKQVIKDLKKK